MLGDKPLRTPHVNNQEALMIKLCNTYTNKDLNILDKKWYNLPFMTDHKMIKCPFSNKFKFYHTRYT